MCTCPTKFGPRGASGRGTPANMCQAYTSVYGWGKIHSLKGCSVSTVVYIAIYSLQAIRDSKYVCVQYMPIRCEQIMCMCTNHSFTFHFCYETKLCCVNSDLIHKIGLKVGDGLVCLHDSRALN